MLILVCWLLLPGCSYLYQEEERLRLSWFGAEKGFLPIAYTTTTTTTTATAPHSVVQIQTKGRGRRRRHVRRATPRHRRCINGQSPLERYKSEDEERKKKVCRHSAAAVLQPPPPAALGLQLVVGLVAVYGAAPCRTWRQWQ